MRDLFNHLLYVASKRMHRSKKLKFIRYLQARFQSLSMECYLHKERVKSGAMRSHTLLNLFAGDLSGADVVIAAGYDTPPRIHSSRYRYYPLNYQKSQQETGSYYVMLLGFALMAGVGILFAASRLEWLYGIIPVAALLLYLMGFKMASPYNFNKNTAALAVMCQVAEQLEPSKKVAFCFLDRCAISSEGYAVFGELVRKTRPQAEIVILDCIANGKHIYRVREEGSTARLPISGPGIRPHVLGEKTKELSPCSFFGRRCTILTCGQPDRDGDIYVSNTCGPVIRWPTLIKCRK